MDQCFWETHSDQCEVLHKRHSESQIWQEAQHCGILIERWTRNSEPGCDMAVGHLPVLRSLL